jgi:ABC-2 type transport system permease protein
MLGKIIGVGMVGLTQFVLWIVVSLVLGTGVSALGLKGNQQQLTEQVAQSNGMAASKQMEQLGNSEVGRLLQSLDTLPVGTIIGCFLFYFLFGYMLYSALFAVVGSAVDNETETQQFMLPVTLPLIFTIMLSQSVIINNPDGALSIWLSMIPLTSPIAMLIRIPFGVPVWQIALSMVLMIGGFIGTTYVASRIYRVGILMYGKKASYKELAKWFMYKE